MEAGVGPIGGWTISLGPGTKLKQSFNRRSLTHEDRLDLQFKKYSERPNLLPKSPVGLIFYRLGHSVIIKKFGLRSPKVF